MLHKIFVQNYILIDNLEIFFENNFSVLTGETGSGKSILLGALGLVVGNRADVSALKLTDNKCIVEAVFNIGNYNIQSFFEENDIDYNEQTILRREISPQGKSRAFINDTPVNLNVLKEIGSQLIDIHSQHQTLNLANRSFQLNVVDAVAQCEGQLKGYQDEWHKLVEIRDDLEKLRAKNEASKDQYEFRLYQLKQLQEAKLSIDEQEELEVEQNKLNNSELIVANLASSISLMNGDESGVLIELKKFELLINEIQQYLPDATEWADRIETARIDLQDVAREIETQADSFDFDPNRLTSINNRLGLIYDLLQKHRMQDVKELLALKESLKAEIETFESFDEHLSDLIKKEKLQIEKVNNLAQKLSESRKSVFAPVEKDVSNLLKQLGMPIAQFVVDHQSTEISLTGIDDIRFLFTSNKQIPPDEIGKIASGGELSRLMLSLKAIMSRRLALPTIVFDEIDTGISGDIADKMAQIMAQMAENMQVISITHLPQIAAKAQEHYLVQKDMNTDITVSTIRMLTFDERIMEIARMLSGAQLGNAAIENARELLSN
ncbi:MAG: DNA repair protein RecN [Salinivirgaceae bacterium]|nr:DNA repair protein RecN [Salinivirgaceae bacterium]MDY0278935.1 DNA repair protein RecN [Salinivirgaceae bacterium]